MTYEVTVIDSCMGLPKGGNRDRRVVAPRTVFALGLPHQLYSDVCVSRTGTIPSNIVCKPVGL